MTRKERLQCLINHYCGGNKARFSEKIGVKPQTISMWMARDSMDYEQILTHCEHVDAGWLITGEGEMLKSENKEDAGIMMASELQPVYGATSKRDDSQLLDIIRQQAEEIGRLKERLRNLEATTKAVGSSPPND